MKIALVFDGLRIGGIEQVGASYAEVLLNLGHEIHIYNLDPDLREMEIKYTSKGTIHYYNFPRKICPDMYSYGVKKYWWGKFAYPLIWLILKVLVKIKKFFYKEKNSRYDLVIAFSGHMNDLTFVAENFLKAKRRLCWLHGALYNYALVCDGFLNLYSKIENLVVLNDDAQDEMFCANKFLKLNITKMYNPIELPAEEDEKKIRMLQKEYGDFLLMVARFAYPHKDHYTVVDAIGVLKKKYNRNIKILFLGDGPEREKVVNYCKEKGLQENIIFAGSHLDVVNYYKACKILVHASVAGEGLPTVMVEAMLCRKPVVATDSKVGPREILGNNEYGLLCPVKASEEMADQIERLLANQSLYEYYAEQGFERTKDFSLEKISMECERLLNNIVGG